MQTARARLREQRTRLEPPNADNILDYQVVVSPMLRRPDHFHLFATKIELTRHEAVRCLFAAPPQHGKTMVTLHGLIWLIRQDPTKRHAYITYNLTRTRKAARLFRHLLTAAGIGFSGTLNAVEFEGGGQVIFTSIDAGLTGEPVDGVAIIDDPYSGPKHAESKARREFVDDCFRQVIMTRVHPKASVLILNTRWHPQDMTATLVEEGWDFINLPAIAEEGDANEREVGEPLFPEERPLKWLLKQKREVGEYAWAALYQGRPRPKGGKVFHEPTWYSELPKVFRGAFGIDLAYTAKSSADWSICVEMWRQDRGKKDDGSRVDPLFYVVHVDREQCELPVFQALLHTRHKVRKAWKMLWRGSGTEKGSASLLKSSGLPIIIKQPPGDKFVSAQEVAAAWNDGRVLLPDPEKFPKASKWVIPFLGVVGDFTGSGKEVDDDVDGLGNAFEALKGVDMPPPKEPDARKRRSEARNLAGF